MLRLVKHPTPAQRTMLSQVRACEHVGRVCQCWASAIVTRCDMGGAQAVCDIASKLGVSGTEHELLAQAISLSSSAAKERRALAGTLCGCLAPFVSQRRADSLLATLTLVS